MICNTFPAGIKALTKLEEFKTKVCKIDLAWCSSQNVVIKSNKIYNIVSTNYSKKFLLIGRKEGGMGMF